MPLALTTRAKNRTARGGPGPKPSDQIQIGTLHLPVSLFFAKITELVCVLDEFVHTALRALSALSPHYSVLPQLESAMWGCVLVERIPVLMAGVSSARLPVMV